jgi:hypothetical protein
MPTNYIKTNSGWNPISQIWIKLTTGWRSVSQGWINVGTNIAANWRQFFPGGLTPVIAAQVTIAKSGSGTVTLTGTNRRWTNFSTGVYYFDSSTDNSNWTQMNTGAITNPGSGATNAKTYVLTQYDVTANTTNYYRFRVEVTSSTPVTATSTSTSTTVEGTRDITDLSATASLLYGSTINLSWTASVSAGSQVVQYKLASSGTWSTFSTASGVATSASVTGLTGGGISYNFRILPYTGASATGYYGNYSNTATASTYAGYPYTFNFGNTIYIGTNGYITFDYGRTDTSIGLVLGRALSMLAADLVQDFLSVAASGSMQYIFWRGHRYGNSNTSEIRLEIQIPNAGGYAYIQYTFTAAVSPSNSFTIQTPNTEIGYYVDGIGPTGGYSNISSSVSTTQQVLIYFGFGASSGPGSGLFSAQGISWAGWIQLDTITTGTLDDGYYALTTVAGSSPSAPTSVSYSSVTGNSASVSWSAPSSLGGSKILSYDYSTDQSNWTNTGLTATASVTGLSASTSYTVYIRANNHFFTGTSYGTTTFTTTAATIAPTSFTASTTFNDKIRLDWSGGSGTSYEFWWGSGVGSVPTATADFTTTNSAQYDWVAIRGFTYYLYIRAATGATKSSWFPTAAPGRTGYMKFYAPPTPTSIINNGSTSTSLTWYWDSPTPSLTQDFPSSWDYAISTSTATPASWSNVTTRPTSGSPLTTSGLSASTTYYLHVKAKNVDAEASSIYGSGTTSAAAPSAPTGLSVSRSVGSDFLSTSLSPSGSGNSTKNQTWSFGRNTTFTINFTRGSNATDSEMYYSTSSSTPGAGTGQNGGTSSSSSGSFSYTAAASTSSGSDTPYYFWVRSYSGSSKSDWTYAGSQNVDTPIYTAFSIVLYRTSVGNANFTTATPSRNDLSYVWTGVNTSFSHQAQVRLTFDGVPRTANS